MDQEKQRAREVIGHFFGSNDPELWKLGRLMCHKLRIDYWVEVEDDHQKVKGKFIRWNEYRRKVRRYSLEEIPEITSRGWKKCVYQIKLEKW